jgi:hypothetical protein
MSSILTVIHLHVFFLFLVNQLWRCGISCNRKVGTTKYGKLMFNEHAMIIVIDCMQIKAETQHECYVNMLIFENYRRRLVC